jgi:class 3 adenylate cyclase
MIFVSNFAVCRLIFGPIISSRQKKVMKSAVQSNDIVSSLFPSNVRSRLYEMEHESPASEPQKTRLKTWLSDGKNTDIIGASRKDAQTVLSGRPIADLFREATVMFTDIAGFTAWASIREPSQVFALLENMYGAFDRIAMCRKVFKVETIGDKYVAVAGLPEPRADHAIVMAKFAKDCRIRMTEVTRALGVTLGPDTEDLSMRFGLHSGPVTAAVLRGQKSRFQLFGDTVNTATRMESTGCVHRIQISQATADHLVNVKKSYWLAPREDSVEVTGKGMMRTYWVEIKGGAKSVATSVGRSDTMHGVANTKLERLVEWNVDVLARLIRYTIHRRQAVAKSNYKTVMPIAPSSTYTGNSNVLGEVKEIIELPDYDGYSDSIEDVDPIVLDPTVLLQLHKYVVGIAKSYEQNLFHTFEHASHLCMSVAKLTSRIISADDVYDNATGMEKGVIESSKHDHTYGITSDPLTQFACVFSALIHDAEHYGVPKTQMVKEDTKMSLKYKGRSVAEQNSVDVAWSLFMDDKFSGLRSAICPTDVK